MDGRLVIISAPSGAGKTTIVRHLLEKIPGLEFSVSATTRPPRGIEKHGHDYYFLSQEEFRKKIEKNEFVEWEEVYAGCFYGTLKCELERIWAGNKSVLFDVDVFGGINLKKIFGNSAVSVFIMPPSVDELARRLETRNTDSRDKIMTRVEKAREEILLAGKFDHVVVNDKLETAKKEVIEIVESFLRANGS